MMRRANQPKHGAPPADLLVCFPSRAHLTLIPKKLSSPARLMDPTFHHRHHLKKLPSTRLGGQTSSSPADSWDKGAKRAGSDVSEPSSPKVTCAGQIKVRPRSGAANCKSWQSVMEEIERIHKKSRNENKKRASWGDALGIKKDVMQFLTCLRNIKLDFRCFGAVPECDLSSEEEEEEEEGEEEEGEADHNKKNMNQSSEAAAECKEEDGTVFSSNWFMVLQDVGSDQKREAAEEEAPSAAPPPNALLLMRCRSAPAKSWLEKRARVIVEEQDQERNEQDAQAHQQQHQDEEEEEEEEETGTVRKKLRDYLLVMEQYDTEFYKLSNDIAKETWVVGSINPFSRSRSSKR